MPDQTSFLVSPTWLAQRLDDPGVRVIEVSAGPDDAAYRAGHLPGALWWYWKDALWHSTDREFPTPGAVWWYWKDALWHPTDREFPTPGEMAQRLGSIGVGHRTTVVLYGDPVQYGAYTFWVLAMCGHPDVRLLDGGRKRWVAEGRPLSTEVPVIAPVAYEPRKGDASSRVGRDNVRAGLGAPGRRLLDVRTPEEYAGRLVGISPDANHGAERAGRIPGAMHLYFREFLNEDDTFKTPDQLRAVCAGAGLAPDDNREVVVYCRLSHRASLAWFALRYLLEHLNVRVYDGSWTEWGSIVGFPIERGSDGSLAISRQLASNPGPLIDDA